MQKGRSNKDIYPFNNSINSSTQVVRQKKSIKVSEQLVLYVIVPPF